MLLLPLSNPLCILFKKVINLHLFSSTFPFQIEETFSINDVCVAPFEHNTGDKLRTKRKREVK
jgi:hypothetical protein